MILAYHTVSSSDALERILLAGEILPAIYRLSSERIKWLCIEYGWCDAGTRAGEALLDLSYEAVEYFDKAQIFYPGTKTQATSLKCPDILSGDAGRIFLSPGIWSRAVEAGWPKTGFAFDVEDLIRRGAVYRPRDLGPQYIELLMAAIRDESIKSKDEAKDKILEGFRKIHKNGELSGDAALRKLERYKLKPGEERMRPDKRGIRKADKPYDEIVWDGPLPVEWALEYWRDGKLAESRLIAQGKNWERR